MPTLRVSQTVIMPGTLLTVLGAWLLADFLSGLVHWWEDRALIGASRFKFINEIREDNERHHRAPGYLTRLSWWDNVSTTAPAAWAVTGVLWTVGAPPLILLTAFFAGFGNLVHRWAHEHPAQVPRAVRALQRTGLFISADHHSGHHYLDEQLISREQSQIRFCVMTNWLNPVLDAAGFFRLLERARRR